MIGPRRDLPVVGSPTGRLSACAASAATYSSAIDSCTRCRPVVMQIWPWWMNEPNAPTDDGLLDVDVVEHDQRGVAAELEVDPLEVLRRRARRRPGRRAVEPVKAITRTSGSVDQRLADVRAAGQHVQQPGRQPGLLEDPGERQPPQTAVRGSGLSTTALPSASAGATARIERMIGKLNGAITPTTPTGSRRAKLTAAARSVRSISPYGGAASAAAS